MLPLAVHKYGKAVNKELVQAMVRTARFGQTAVVATAAKTKPKPEATQTYRNSWGTTKTRKGAILGNSALASYFVERGRRPGKMPPYSDPSQGILAWVIAKKFNTDADGNVSRKQRKTKAVSPTPAPKQTQAQKSQAKAQRAAAKAAGAGNAGAVNAARAKSKKATNKKPPKYQGQLRIAHLIARKIAKKGTPARRVLARTMPEINKRAKKETLKAIQLSGQKGTP